MYTILCVLYTFLLCLHVNIYTHLTLPFSAVPSLFLLISLLPSLPCHSLALKLSRDKKTLEEKLQETQTALETEENKSKQEHRQRLKLESHIQDLDEKLHRETNVSQLRMICRVVTRE